MYEIFEHTADIGIRVRADALDALLADAACGLFSVMVTNFDAVQAVDETTIRVEGRDPEELLHDWLAELLYTFHAKRLAFSEFRVQVDSAGITAVVRGEPIDLARHQIDVEVKAITWHALKVEQAAGRWTAEVIVDI
jgi:SHS2 domain-containing protein